MPNQLNYQIPIPSTDYNRPERFTNNDLALLNEQQLPLVFGTNSNQVVELWIYNPDGTFGGHLTLPYNDSRLTLQTYVDTTGTDEILILDLGTALLDMSIQPGRYALVANFFQDDVGSESGYKLYISQISPDRTELQLKLVNSSSQAIQDIFNFITPSVPKLFAQGLLEEILNQDIDNLNSSFSISPTSLAGFLENLISGTINRINTANAQTAYTNLVNIILQQIYVQSLNLMAADNSTIQVINNQLVGYLNSALNSIISQMNSSGLIDPRFLVT